MLFNSLQFLVFFPLVVACYFALPHRFRWMLLLAASYYFYMCWKAEYLVLILVSTLIDYGLGLWMGRTVSRPRRRWILALSLLGNLGLLFSFKYFNFFNDSLRAILDQVNIFYDVPAFRLLLPVGISFYTFQSLSYTIDVYRGERGPERHLGLFALYVAFFPQLVAGPIERSTHLLPQFYERHRFDPVLVKQGLALMLWGFFKKVVVADRLALYVNEVYNHPGDYLGAPVWLATYLFAFQIYCDFSGYSDIAVGSARVMGFRIMNNFNFPYAARSIGEFWKRWHISLSTWFRDYLYIPLGGSHVSRGRWYYNILIVFVISGLWHGANWTFVVWGALHGSYYLLSAVTRGLREPARAAVGLARAPRLLAALQVILTFHLVCLAWIFFRANSLADALVLLRSLWPLDLSRPGINVALGRYELAIALASILFMEAVHLVQRSAAGAAWFRGWPTPVRWGAYYALVFAILILGVFNESEFIYFQF